MRARAVVFDLWNTLVPYPEAEAEVVKRDLAERLGISFETWLENRPSRDTGPLADYFRFWGASEELTDELLATRHAFTRRALRPHDGVVETLDELRRRGFRLGLISVCSDDVPTLWPETEFAGRFDAAVFSATCGLVKPDPRIYHLACRELSVEPADCVFVGDGANDELAGATRVGMRPIKIGPEPGWDGLRITSISEVLQLVAAV